MGLQETPSRRYHTKPKTRTKKRNQNNPIMPRALNLTLAILLLMAGYTLSQQSCDPNNQQHVNTLQLCEQALSTCQTAMNACSGNKICENTAIAAYNAAVLGLANQLGACKCNLGYCRAGVTGGSGKLQGEIAGVGMVGWLLAV